MSTPERAADPSPEALSFIDELSFALSDADRRGWGFALDSFRREGVERERQRCAAIVASESFNDEEAFDRMERNILSGASP